MAIDATVAGATADSYLTVAAADAYAAADLGPDVDAWLAATLANKEAALKLATADIDAEYGRDVIRYSTTQALVFPRSTDVVATVATLPAGVKRATWEQAKYRYANRKLFADARARRARGLASFSDDDGSGTMSLHTDLEGLSMAARRFLAAVTRVRPGGRRIVGVPIGTPL